MIDANPGDILDDAYPYHDIVYATLVIDPCATACTISKGMDAHVKEAGESHSCPVCHGPVVNNVKARHPKTKKAGRFMWCATCWLIYTTISIGTLDKHGNYHPYEE